MRMNHCRKWDSRISVEYQYLTLMTHLEFLVLAAVLAIELEDFQAKVKDEHITAVQGRAC